MDIQTKQNHTKLRSSSPNDDDADKNTTTCQLFPESLQIISQTFSIIIGIAAVYLTISLVQHFNVTTKRYQREGRNRTISSVNAIQGKLGRVFKQMMSMHTISATLCVLTRCVLDVVIFQIGFIGNQHYVAFSQAKILLNIAALSSIYLILWIRLWSFYCHPGLDDSKLRKLKVICVALLGVMIATGIWNAFAFLADRDITLDYRGCIITNTSNTKFYILGVCTLFYQAVLLGLFAYPLFLHTRKSVVTERGKRKSVLRVLKRVLIAASVCSFSDLVTTVLSAVLENIYPESSFLLYNINIATNLVALLYSFGDWKSRVLHPFMFCYKSKPNNWAITTTVVSNNQSSQI